MMEDKNSLSPSSSDRNADKRNEEKKKHDPLSEMSEEERQEILRRRKLIDETLEDHEEDSKYTPY